jgi:hypothetical protein
MKGIETNSLFVLGEGVIELVAVVVEPRVVGILRLTPRAPHGDTPAKKAGDRDSAASLIGASRKIKAGEGR